jgi:glycosyltransferase involved in cell wall biosynthesis
MSDPRLTRLALVLDSHEYGGAESYLASLARRLPERYAVELVGTPPVPEPLVEAVVARHGRVLAARPVANKLDLRGLAALAGALRAARPDVVHVNLNSVTNNRHAVAIASIAWPTVATFHIGTEISSSAQRRLLPLAFARVAQVIAVSEEIAAQVHDDLRLPAAKLAVIPNGVPEAPAITIRESPSPLRVGGLGRLTGQKGFDVLIDAIARLRSDGLAVEAVIGGEGPERPVLERLAGGLPVALPGWVSDPGPFLSGLDVFCLPSRWEGLPFALLEAMVRGLPCVCTPVGDVASAVGDSCVLVAPDDPGQLADALRELALDSGRRRALGAAARERALARHSVGRMVELTAAVYDEVARRR